MGGLFSSQKPEPQINEPQRPYYKTYQQPHDASNNYYRDEGYINRENIVPNYYLNEGYRNRENIVSNYYSNYYTTAQGSFRRESLSSTGYCRKVTPPKIVIKNDILDIQHDPYFIPSNVVVFIQLPQHDPEYQAIRRKVTNKHNFIIDGVEKIENPYLKKAYYLKKEQKLKRHPNLEECLLFHGTKHENLESICKFNFNWRFCKTHKYGAGISFSPNSTYASNYSDEHVFNKVMIVAKVLIGKSCFGNENMVLPNEGCDTSQKGQDGIVIVKYEDNEFYPAFKINYHLKNPNLGRNYIQRKNRNNM